MKTSDRGLLFQDLERLFHRGTVSSGDGALLESFLTEGNESAFEALVTRHGPMVRGVCRRLLPNSHDADDAFQATFLVLARKGGRLRDPDRLGPWLYGVATRVATKARARSARRREREIADVHVHDESNAEWSDVMPIIDAELSRLPTKHRDVLVTCLLEGASTEEASRRLGCPAGTVKSRLARARETLRARLTSRGVTPAVALAVLTSSNVFASPAPSTLTRATLKTITAKVVPPGVAALIKGVAPAMFTKSSLTALVFVGGLGLAGLSAAYWPEPSLAQGDNPPAIAENQPAESTEKSRIKVNNLRRILVAFHNYADTHGAFPSAAILGEDRSPTLSWRVALLPFIEQNELYQKFRLNEPWDSPHNKALIPLMPSVFETPDSPAPEGQTRFRGFAGKGTMFEPSPDQKTGVGIINLENEKLPVTKGQPRSVIRQGVRFAEVTDGTSNTVFLAVARDATVWTRPGELPFVQGQELPALDESDPTGVVLAFADGSVQLLPLRQNSQALLTASITRNGGEFVDRSLFTYVNATGGAQTTPSPARPARLNPTPAPTPPQPAAPSSLERRLQNVEEKLDRILQKLDPAPPADDAPKP